ncbi:MAG: hypothetical protein ACREHE_02615 [Rhizomicrobium sp.]
MNVTVKKKGPVARVLDEQLSEAALDRRLAGRREEIDGLLREAHDAKSRGRFAPLEPLHAFLRRARSRLKSGA